jgi:ArsR family transcriptional regulator
MMRSVVAITKALADDTRLRILCALSKRELCVCQIIELFKLAPSTISKHLFILSSAGLVEGRKDGRWIYYRLASEDAPKEVKEALVWVRTHLRKSPVIRNDAKRLRAVLKMGVEALCKARKPRKKKT